jgi:uncharacterized YigZ family protein
MFCVNNSENIIIINKSKFITNIFYINNLNDINIYLNKIKEKYKDATHHCYAYIINNTKRFNDDGEPNGTAGMPILDCLEKNKLNHTLCIVTRYFGGIKLGAGGLVRAYSNSISNALKNSKFFKLKDGYKIKITFEYNNSKQVDNLVKDYEITKKEYGKVITYELLITNDFLNKLNKSNIKYEIINKEIIKEEI